MVSFLHWGHLYHSFGLVSNFLLQARRRRRTHHPYFWICLTCRLNKGDVCTVSLCSSCKSWLEDGGWHTTQGYQPHEITTFRCYWTILIPVTSFCECHFGFWTHSQLSKLRAICEGIIGCLYTILHALVKTWSSRVHFSAFTSRPN
jgi:hypothetical protein